MELVPARPALRPKVVPMRPPARAGELAAAADALEAVGLTPAGFARGKEPLVPDGAPPAEAAITTRAAIAAGTAVGLAVLLGAATARPTDDASLAEVAVALDVPAALRAGKTPRARAWQRQAVTHPGLRDLLTALDAGWVVETPGKDTRYLCWLQVPSAPGYADMLLGDLEKRALGHPTLPALRTHVALVRGAKDLDPAGAYRDVVGGPMEMATVGVRALLAAVEGWEALEDPPPGARPLTPGEAEAASEYARRATDDSSIPALEQAGWQPDGLAVTGAGKWRRGPGRLLLGGPDRPSGSVLVRRTDGVLAEGWHSAWALRLTLAGGDPAALLDDLLERGEVSRPVIVLVAPDVEQVDVGLAEPAALLRLLLRRWRDAKHPTCPDTPLVLGRRSGTRVTELVSITADGRGVRVWDAAGAAALADMVARPVKAGKYSDANAPWPRSTLDAAWIGALEAARAGDGVAVVDVLATRPVLLGDGTTLTRPGWHPEHHAILLPEGDWSAYAPPPDPSHADAQAALDWLHAELLADFEFLAPGDRARAVTWLLTCASREHYGACPGFLLTANEAKSGKGLLSAVGRVIANGHQGRTMSSPYRRDDVDTAKRVVTAMVTHPAETHFLHADEVARGSTIDSLLLSEIITSEDGAISDRLLGHSREVVYRGCVVTMNGNNVVIGGDFSRRLFPVQLRRQRKLTDEGLEDVSGWRHEDLASWVAEHRPEVLAACHTILARPLRERAAGVDARRPPIIDSFAAWSRLVLGALADLRLPGDELSVAEVAHADWAAWKASNDALESSWGGMVAWLQRHHGATPFTVSTIFKELEDFTTEIDFDLPGQVVAAFANNTDVNARRAAIGRALAGICRTPFVLEDGTLVQLEKVEQSPNSKRATRFRLVPFGPAGAQESPSPTEIHDGIYEEEPF